MSENLQVMRREHASKSNVNQLRKDGWVPGVIYGKSMAATPIRVKNSELLAWIRKEGRHSLVHIQLDGEQKMNAMIHDLQTDSLDRSVTHIDFLQIKKGDKVNTSIPIQLVGTSAGESEGGVLQQQLLELEVRGVPENMPTSLEVSIDHLEIGDIIRANDISLPAGIELRSDENDVVASVILSKLDPVEEEIDTEHPAMVETTQDE